MRILSDQAGGISRRRSTTLSSEGGGRGMALLMVLTSIAVLTSVAIEFAWQTRVDTTLAATARDELRAHYLARSAVNLSRLLLHFQYQLDRQSGGPLGLLGQAGGAAGGMPKIRLWELIPIESEAVNTFVGSVAAPPSDEVPAPPPSVRPGQAVPATGLRSFGSFEGGFAATIQDEESKINVNKLNNPGSRGAIAMQQLLLLWNDPRWDFLFEEETRWRERYTREEIALHIRDWIDENETGSAIDRVTGEIADGFSDELGPYTRYPQRYQPKNALFDSVEELYLVAGVSDRLMAAFGDRLTVFPDINAKLNVNTSDPMQQYANILVAAADPNLPILRDPVFVRQVLEQLEMARAFGGFIGLTVQQFVGILKAAGIPVKPAIEHNPQGNDELGDSSQTFRIEGVGRVGDVSRRITAVVRYDEGLGKLLYWRED